MASHDNNVKRHLDFFDLEAALTEASRAPESSNAVIKLTFASDFIDKRYSQRLLSPIW